MDDEEANAGLGVNQPKSRVMRMNARCQADVIFKKPLVNILEFKCLGSFLTADDGVEKVLTMITHTSAVFQRLGPMWNYRQLSTTKLRVYKYKVR